MLLESFIWRHCQLLRLHIVSDILMSEHGAMVKWYWQGKTEVVIEKRVSLPFWPSQIPRGLAWHRKRFSAVRGRRFTRSMWLTHLPLTTSLDGISRTECCSVTACELTNQLSFHLPLKAVAGRACALLSLCVGYPTWQTGTTAVLKTAINRIVLTLLGAPDQCKDPLCLY